MNILLIDNYDSFTFNLRQLLVQQGATVTVWRNDCFKLSQVDAFDKLVLSPGPGIPDEAGLLKDVVRTYATSKPILGVCLGHQAIAEVFGGKLTNLSSVFHGVQTEICLTDDDYLFDNMPPSFPVGRYHSWVVDHEGLPNDLLVTSVSQEGQIMSLRHRTLDIHGVQYHPESILTPLGERIISNFVHHNG